MKGYVINLDREPARWRHITAAFQATDIQLVRVSALDGTSMQPPANEFDPSGYLRRHGRRINIFEVACYLSHLKALRAFLDSIAEEAAMIMEDDVTPSPALDGVVREALKLSGSWSILRLSGLSGGKPLRVRRLTGTHSVYVNFGRLKGAGAYMINRAAARCFVEHLLPVRLPYDHAMDREWLWGLNAACVLPFPVSQTERQFRSSIQHNSQPKLGGVRRLCTTYPYQAINELNRYAFRLRSFAAWKVNGGPVEP
jgi:glycosyl transferase family 25